MMTSWVAVMTLREHRIAAAYLTWQRAEVGAVLTPLQLAWLERRTARLKRRYVAQLQAHDVAQLLADRVPPKRGATKAYASASNHAGAKGDNQ